MTARVFRQAVSREVTEVLARSGDPGRAVVAVGLIEAEVRRVHRVPDGVPLIPEDPFAAKLRLDFAEIRVGLVRAFWGAA